MTTDPQVTHPPVTHPDTITPAAPAVTPESTAKPAEKPAAGRTNRRALRMPPPKVITAAVLVVAALELLLWQVAGVFWAVLVHGMLVALAAVALLVWRRRLRRQEAGARGRAVERAARSLAGAGRQAGRGPLGRLFGRRGASGTGGSAGGKRAGLFGARSSGTGRGRGLLGRLGGGGRRTGAGRTGSGTGRSGGLLGRLGRTASGRRTASGTGRPAGRSGGLLGRLGRSATGRRTTGTRASGTGGRRTGLGAALGRMRSGSRAGRTGQPRKAKAGPLVGFLRGVREGAKPKPQAKKPTGQPTPEPRRAAPKEKPQLPTTEQLVKEAVEKVPAADPAPVAAPIRGGRTVVGDMNKIRAAADELAAALKDYDPEDMHQMVREMPLLGEGLNAISNGLRQIASRAESEWPVAAPVAEGYRSIANDVKAGAGTAEETRGTVRRENETDIERGEAPRHGSISVERKWNV